VNRALAEEIVGCLRKSDPSGVHVARLRAFDRCDWERTLYWLHRSGLALYFAGRLSELNAEDAVPAEIVTGLQQNRRDNEDRGASMMKELAHIDHAFKEKRVRYVVEKGLSLVPDYCPNPSLRHQCDFDFLIDMHCQDMAVEALEGIGYVLSAFSRSSEPSELRFWRRLTETPPSAERFYDAFDCFMVELHFSICEVTEICEKTFGAELEDIREQSWDGLCFPALPETDAFLLQLLHCFKHVVIPSLKLSWLFEIAYFLRQRTSGDVLWRLARERIREQPRASQACGVVLSLVHDVFGAQIAPELSSWTIDTLSPAASLWVKRYGRDLAFADFREQGLFPKSKLSLLLWAEFMPDTELRWSKLQRMLFPARGGWSLARGTHPLVQEFRINRWRHFLHRLKFHIGASLRYFWELPRWKSALRRLG